MEVQSIVQLSAIINNVYRQSLQSYQYFSVTFHRGIGFALYRCVVKQQL